jgi:hypothetical protein
MEYTRTVKPAWNGRPAEDTESVSVAPRALNLAAEIVEAARWTGTET